MSKIYERREFFYDTRTFGDCVCSDSGMENVYNQCEALSVGTIFPELNMPFFAADSVGAGGQHSALKGCADIPARAGENSEGQQQKAMMRQIQEVSFVADDVRLYMDTHPEDQKGWSSYKLC